MQNKKECIYPKCVNPSVGRGLCANHYYQAKRLINNNRTTWDKLEQKGIAKRSRTQIVEDSAFLK